MIRREAVYDNRRVIILLDGGDLSLRLMVERTFKTPNIPLHRDQLYAFEYQHRMRFGPNGTNPRLVASDVEIESHEPQKVRVLLKGKLFCEGPLDPMLFAVRAQLANWSAWEMRRNRAQ